MLVKVKIATNAIYAIDLCRAMLAIQYCFTVVLTVVAAINEHLGL